MTNTTKSRIAADHPVRDDFDDCSNDYDTKSHAICVFEAVLNEYGLCFDPDNCINMNGDNGCIPVGIWSDKLECTDHVGTAILRWRRVERSGKWEVSGFIV